MFLDLDLRHIPLRDLTDLISDMQNIIRMYNKTGGRNQNALLHDKLGKHMMHLVRLYYTCFDILEQHKIITYRAVEHNLLMDLRNGVYLKDNKPTPEFSELLNQLERRLEYDKNNTDLPDKPNMQRIKDFRYYVYKQIISQG